MAPKKKPGSKPRPPPTRPSMRKAINGFCRWCIVDENHVGTWLVQVSICSSTDCQLKNARDFTHLLERFPGIKGVIGGHTHTAAEKRNPGHIQYISPSSFAQILHDQPEDLSADGGFWSSHRLKRASHGFRVLDLRPDGRISSEVHWPGAD